MLYGAFFKMVCCLHRPLGRAVAAQHPILWARGSCIRSVRYRRRWRPLIGTNSLRARSDVVQRGGFVTVSDSPRRVTNNLFACTDILYISFNPSIPLILAISLNQYALPWVLTPVGYSYPFPIASGFSYDLSGSISSIHSSISSGSLGISANRFSIPVVW